MYPGGVVFCSSAMIVTVRGAIQPAQIQEQIKSASFIFAECANLSNAQVNLQSVIFC